MARTRGLGKYTGWLQGVAYVVLCPSEPLGAVRKVYGETGDHTFSTFSEAQRYAKDCRTTQNIYVYTYYLPLLQGRSSHSKADPRIRDIKRLLTEVGVMTTVRL
ncbi:hypothetical protein MTO96_031177 [Rhipicephalus appendiculatus]